MNNAPAFRDALQSAASSCKPAALAGAIDITAPLALEFCHGRRFFRR